MINKLERAIRVTTKVVWLLVLIAIPTGFYISDIKTEKYIQQFLENKNFEKKQDGIYSSKGNVYVVSSASGFGGDVLCLVEFNKNLIENAFIINHNETPTYFKKCYALLESIKGCEINDQEFGFDSVSGATISANAINKAVNNAIYMYKGKSLPTPFSLKVTFYTYFIILIILLSILLVFIKNAKINKILYSLQFILVLLIIGFLINKPLSLALLSGVLFLSGTYVLSDLDSLLLFSYALLSIFILGKNNYCKHVCPFGVFQDGCTLLFKPKLGQKHILSRVNLPLLITGAVLIPAALSQSPGRASYEIYSGIFDFSLNTIGYLLLMLTIMLLFFYKRPWCNYFCPTGAIFNYTLKIRNRVWKRLKA